ncbi:MULTISPECIES: DUF2059 domain-containing protein [Psychrobacter]|jgi:hypothetical protein|uniref:DUF2059 domain-containing protein n=1 Tax=Psychrobacter communis TaxID=2762238 RepID=A0ABR8RH61_9GAMM|nr:MULTISPECIES: DUF2059 domain-containing protein [Psychrobacter]MBD7947138.1 DUF2059 domain-containing protein [Psychrobacter communis]MBO6198955.1 DUF2059 domain-containing protein [Psychrobacter sp.]WLW67112.1 DUF2059 domain-containing protein [Psychrobacter sp. van23A]
MKNYLKSSKKNTSRRPTSINPLLTLVVTTLLSAPIVNANAELIVHSEPNRVSKGTNNIAKQQMNNQAPTDVSIIKLMQVMHIDAQIQSIVNGQQAAIDAINTQTKNQNQSSNQRASDQQLNKRQRELQEQIQSVLGQYTKIMTEGIGNAADAQTLTQAYISAAKTYYTQAEVDAQIKFYDTAVGQSILAKQPQITAAFLQQSLPEDTSETEAQLSELLPQMKQIIKGVF